MTGTTVRAVGGARIGWVNATWPFALLSVSEQALTVTVAVLGRYTFRRDQVVAIEPYTVIPLLGGGLRIEHTVAEHPRHIVFWCLGPPRSLIKRIHHVGFIPEGRLQDMPAGRGIAVRWQTLIVGIALWNLLLLLDIQQSSGGGPRLPTFLAFLILFLVSTNIWWSRSLQALVLKPGRNLSETKHWLGLLTLISGLLCFTLGLQLLGHLP